MESDTILSILSEMEEEEEEEEEDGAASQDCEAFEVV